MGGKYQGIKAFCAFWVQMLHLKALDGKFLFFSYLQGPASMMAYLIVSGFFLTRLRRPIGKMTIIEQKYEGEYRYVNSRLITNRYKLTWLLRYATELLGQLLLLKYGLKVWHNQFWAKVFTSLCRLLLYNSYFHYTSNLKEKLAVAQ